jgi:hypothetical protein
MHKREKGDRFLTDRVSDNRTRLADHCLERQAASQALGVDEVCRKRILFSSFPCVCPEPVLVK